MDTSVTSDKYGDRVVISLEYYEKLVDDSVKLAALEAAGVDNWEGYSEAMQSVSKNKED